MGAHVAEYSIIFGPMKGGRDDFRHKGMRQKLVDSLKSKGIGDEKVLEAINKVPRHHFMDSGFLNFSYTDKAFPISAGQTISQPYTVAFQTELLEVEPHMKVLEVGTGSGYQAAILLELGARVYTIERQRQLYLEAQKNLEALNYKPLFFFGDGYEGLPAYAPFDRILVTAAAPETPQSLLEQLQEGGMLVVPEGGRHGQKMVRITKKADGGYERTEHGYFSFVPLLRGKNR